MIFNYYNSDIIKIMFNIKKLNKLNKLIKTKDKNLYERFIICFIILFRNMEISFTNLNMTTLFSNLWLVLNENKIRRNEGIKSIKTNDFDLIFNNKYINNCILKSNKYLVKKLIKINKQNIFLDKKILKLL